MSDYSLKDLEKIIKNVIHKDTDIAFVAGDLGALGSFDSFDKFDLLNTIRDGIFKASDDNATIHKL